MSTFNAHMGISRQGAPFDVVSICKRLDSDVIVVQESWWPDDDEGFATAAARSLGYRMDTLPMARARIGRRGEPAGRRRGARATGTIGVAVLTRVPVRQAANLDM